MKTVQMMVTPDLAREWLKGNTRNRPVTANAARALADEIKAGRWRTTHQGIARAEDGTLLDGQHRLLAIVLAGIAVEMLVTFDAPFETMPAIDIGGCGIRKPHHVIEIMTGVHHSTTIRAAVISAAHILSGRPQGGGGRTKLTVVDLRAALDSHGADAESVVKVVGKEHNRLCQAPVNGALTLLHRIQPKEALNFAALLRSGESLSAGHPAFALRNYVLLDYNPDARKNDKGQSSRDLLADRTFGAFDAFRKGEARAFTRANPAAREFYVRAWNNLTSEAR
jgi:hypothetical protein